MPAALQNIELMHGWVLGETLWGDAMNANLRKVDALAQAKVIDKDLTAPPGSPTSGDTYIVGPAATGSWSTHDKKIARYNGTIWEFFPPKSGWLVFAVDEARYYSYVSANWVTLTSLLGITNYYEKQVACSDYDLSPLEVGEVMGWRQPRAFTLAAVRISLQTAQASGALFTVDIRENGVTVLSTLLTIDNTETTSVTAVTPAVISDVAIADDSRVTIHVTQIGNGTAKGLVATLIGSY